ncbi:MAG: hypothetical protein ACKO0N_08010, partial [Planctomycetota bacterium]
ESFGCDRIKHLLCPARATHAEIAGNKRASFSSSSTSRESALTLPLEVASAVTTLLSSPLSSPSLRLHFSSISCLSVVPSSCRIFPCLVPISGSSPLPVFSIVKNPSLNLHELAVFGLDDGISNDFTRRGI